MIPGPLVCDLDGTIADTAPLIFECLHVTCAAFDITIGDRDLMFALGPPLHWVLEQLGVDEDVMPDAISVFQTAHTERISMIVPMPGADEVLAELAHRGIGIGVATIKPEPIAQLVLEHLNIASHVTVMHARYDDLDARTKTDLVRGALAELPGDWPLYTGDHDNDELAAKECGIRFLRYPDYSWGHIRTEALKTG